MKKISALIITLSLFAFALCFSASAAKISAPKAVKATTTTSSVTLSWSKVKGADYYRIYYRLSTNDKWKTAVTKTTATTKTFEKLPAGRKYFFAVRSFDKTKNGADYSEMKKLNTATKPAVPEKITVTPTVKTVKLKWSKVEGATHYRVYQNVNGNWKNLGMTTKTGKTIKNLKSDTSYTFAVRAYVKTKTINVFGAKKTVKATTNRAPDDNYVAKTDGGIKLYPITSAEAKAIHEKWGDYYFDYYEGKNKNGTTLIYTYVGGKWDGFDINGSLYNSAGKKIICPYCGKTKGLGTNMCNGCNITLG